MISIMIQVQVILRICFLCVGRRGAFSFEISTASPEHSNFVECVIAFEAIQLCMQTSSSANIYFELLLVCGTILLRGDP